MLFRRRKDATAVIEPGSPEDPELADASIAELYERIEELSAENRAERDLDLERRILRLRHRAGARLTEEPASGIEWPTPSSEPLRKTVGVAEASIDELTPELLRAGMLDTGCMLIRGLISPDEAAEFVDGIDAAFAARAEAGDGETGNPFFEEFVPNPPFTLLERDWVNDAGGFWTADSPRLLFDVVEMFERTGLRKLATDYLGERPTLSINKCVLRRVPPEAGSAWHQDGAFLGDVRALNVWLSLSHCGDDAPGLDLIPKRLDGIVPTGTEGAIFDWSVSPQVAEEAAGDAGIISPIFEPGDVLLFDDIFLHATGISPEMTKTRYAIESWFFGASGYPGDYVPIAL